MIKNKKLGGRPTVRPDADWLVKYYEEHTAREIAEMFDVSISTVRSWVCRIKQERKE